MLSLPQLDVLVVDCQATAAAPRGHLLELGWARVATSIALAHSRLIALPHDAHVPPAVRRITGISEPMLGDGVDADTAWRELLEHAAALADQPAPTVIHFARFEEPFLRLLAGGTPPLDIVCTHDIARRLLPHLPRRSLRALAGYFGHGVGAFRRSRDHVAATAFLWRALLPLLDAEGISTWSALREWLGRPVDAMKPVGRVWPMAREVRLSLPNAPGIYRFQRSTGDVLYVGKASSLHRRVNSYFRHRRGLPERMLELLSQTRAISIEVTPSALEAALLETDEIKRRRPPYNVALTLGDRGMWFTPPDLSGRRPSPSPRFSVGPFPSAETVDQFAALAQRHPRALQHGRWGPDAAVFNTGYARLAAAHREFAREDLGAAAKLLRLGTRLWREGRRDESDEDAGAADYSHSGWTEEQAQHMLERLALRAALARRRARWLTSLVDVTVVWREPDAACARLIIVENGEIAGCAVMSADAMPPIPPGYQRPVAARLEAFTVARFDRLRVLTTELKRLVAGGAPVAVRFGAPPALAGARLASALSWV